MTMQAGVAPEELDPRSGKQVIWITATEDNHVLDWDRLQEFATKAGARLSSAWVGRGYRNTIVEVDVCDYVRAIRVEGPRTMRNRVLTALSSDFYAAGFKWITTVDNFAWLKTRFSY